MKTVSRSRRLSNGVELVLLRKDTIPSALSSAQTISHSSLVNLDANDHPQYALLDYVNASIQELNSRIVRSSSTIQVQDTDDTFPISDIPQSSPVNEFSLAGIQITTDPPVSNDILVYDGDANLLLWRSIFDLVSLSTGQTVDLNPLIEAIEDNSLAIDAINATVQGYPQNFSSEYIKSKLIHLTFNSPDSEVDSEYPYVTHGLQWIDHSSTPQGYYGIDVGGGSAAGVCGSTLGYHYGDVTGLSMRFTISSDANRGWVFSSVGPNFTPVFAISNVGQLFISSGLTFVAEEPVFYTSGNVEDAKHGYILTYNSGTSAITLQANTGTGGTVSTDHGALAGLFDNDHPQYTTTAQSTLDRAHFASHTADSSIHYAQNSIDHGNILGLLDDDHPQYAKTGSSVQFNVVSASTIIATGDPISIRATQSIALNTDATGVGAVYFCGATQGQIRWANAGGWQFFIEGGDVNLTSSIGVGQLVAVGTLNNPSTTDSEIWFSSGYNRKLIWDASAQKFDFNYGLTVNGNLLVNGSSIILTGETGIIVSNTSSVNRVEAQNIMARDNVYLNMSGSANKQANIFFRDDIGAGVNDQAQRIQYNTGQSPSFVSGIKHFYFSTGAAFNAPINISASTGTNSSYISVYTSEISGAWSQGFFIRYGSDTLGGFGAYGPTTGSEADYLYIGQVHVDAPLKVDQNNGYVGIMVPGTDLPGVELDVRGVICASTSVYCGFTNLASSIFAIESSYVQKTALTSDTHNSLTALAINSTGIGATNVTGSVSEFSTVMLKFDASNWEAGLQWGNANEAFSDSLEGYYGIHCANAPTSGYAYADVTGISMRFSMDSTTGRGWVWSRRGGSPEFLPVMSLTNYGQLAIRSGLTFVETAPLFKTSATTTNDKHQTVLAYNSGTSAVTLTSVENTRKASISIMLDGGGSAITAGTRAWVYVPFSCRLVDWVVLGDTTGSISIDVQKDTYANYPLTTTDSITGATAPGISSADKGSGTTASWTSISASAGDVIQFSASSISTITRCLISLNVLKDL